MAKSSPYSLILVLVGFVSRSLTQPVGNLKGVSTQTQTHGNSIQNSHSGTMLYSIIPTRTASPLGTPPGIPTAPSITFSNGSTPTRTASPCGTPTAANSTLPSVGGASRSGHSSALRAHASHSTHRSGRHSRTRTSTASRTASQITLTDTPTPTASTPQAPATPSATFNGTLAGTSNSPNNAASPGATPFHTSSRSSVVPNVASESPSTNNATAAATSSSSATDPGTAGAMSGKATWFNVGLGSCGQTNTDSELVVALATSTMSGGQSCGKNIQITDASTGKASTAKVVDTCPSCAAGDLDMSPTLFREFQSLDVGVFQVNWSFE
ncbi:hypothetical protein P691DRAFT_699142 [Macrolepiota fuliginosa MF-IS2]|uniref:Barwin domain-containing protein n=1 Tax=Macrolepiota fuliginosa MF-IS2 TaxID=1400762 RepID=A0A9P6C476_9AGAR|nr:hypothetical protein P691DRAFT_699142 [Macrolepiota fuliginosa MF-IS2]